jgi:feruloyl-CoA synthase
MNVTPGYFKDPVATSRRFDEEGYYCTGDAMRFLDPANPEQGLTFDGRLSEDFKLSSGTWVSVGSLRVELISALAPLAADVVVAGQDREYVAVLVFPNLGACKQLATDLPPNATPGQVLAHPAVCAHVRAGLRSLRRNFPGSSMHARSAILLEEPASIDSGEITDKGYINQRAVLDRRVPMVRQLYGEFRPETTVISIEPL